MNEIENISPNKYVFSGSVIYPILSPFVSEKLTAMWNKIGKVVSHSKRPLNIRFLQYYADLCLNNMHLDTISPVTTLFSLLHYVLHVLRKDSKSYKIYEVSLIALCTTVCMVSRPQESMLNLNNI